MTHWWTAWWAAAHWWTTWWAALGMAGVLATVVAAACFAGLRRVARRSDKSVRKRWREAAEAWTAAWDALREARVGVRKAATNLAAEKRRLKRMLRELKAAGQPSSPLTGAGDAGDSSARQAMADMEEKARHAVADAGRTLADHEAEAHRLRGALAERRRDVRKRAREACDEWRRRARERRAKIRREAKEGFHLIWKFLGGYVDGVKPMGWKDLLNVVRNYWAVGSLLLSLAAICLDLVYYRHFGLDALEYYSSASLPALATTVLTLAGVALLTFAALLAAVVLFAGGVGFAFWLPVALIALLQATALRVLGVLPLTACRSTLCARLAAPGRGTDA